MTAAPIVIAAVVDHCERPVLERAAARLQDALAAAGATRSVVRVTFVEALAATTSGEAPDFVVASLLPELWHDEPVVDVDKRWRASLAALPGGGAPVLVCTIFRHVDPGLPPVRREAMRERIRRLALAAVEISHDTGANVIDFDRTLSHVGGRTLQSDCRLHGDAAIEVAAGTVVRSILAIGQDDVIAPEIATLAEASVGQPWDFAEASVSQPRDVARAARA